jgi:DNA-binding MarR family transcriptional regulator
MISNTPGTHEGRPLPHHLVDEIIDDVVPLLARLREAWVAKLHAHGMSMTHHQVIAILESEGAIPMGRLAERLGVSLPSASGIVERMVERGLVERLRDADDRRVVLVRLSPAGRRLVREFHAVRRAQMRRLLDQLDAVQQQRLLLAIRDIRDVVATSTHRVSRSQQST